MEQGTGSDVDNALDLFIGDTKGEKKVVGKGIAKQPPQKVSNTKESPKRKHRKKQPTPSESETTTRTMPTSRIGRIPGHTPKYRGPKSKTTLRIDAELMDEYRERVFVERRPLGELVEDAMRFNKRKNWSDDS